MWFYLSHLLILFVMLDPWVAAEAVTGVWVSCFAIYWVPCCLGEFN